MNDVHEDYLTKAIGKDSIRYIGSSAIKWLVASIVVFFTVYFFNIDKNICSVCGAISKNIKFVEIYAEASNFPNALRMQWLFLIATSFIYFYLLLKNINKIKHGDLSTRIPIFNIVIISMFAYVFINASPSNNDSGGIISYALGASIFLSPIISFVIFCGITCCIFIVFIYLKALMEHILG